MRLLGRLSLRAQVLAAAITLIASCVVAFSLVSYQSARGLILDNARERVALEAEVGVRHLLAPINQHYNSALALLDRVRRECAASELRQVCLEHQLNDIMVHSAALDGRLVYGELEARGGRGAAELDVPRWSAGQLASLEPERAGARAYVVGVREGNLSLAMRYSADELTRGIGHFSAMGIRGNEVFLDAHGSPVRPMRTASLTPAVTQRCLSGPPGYLVAPDVTGATTIYGLRPTAELGGGCLVARISEHEALAPARAFRVDVMRLGCMVALVTALVALLLARGVTEPVRSLTARVRRLRYGDYESPIDEGGPKEVRQLGGSFAELAEALRQSRLALSVSREHNRETHEELRSVRELLELVIEQSAEGIVVVDELGVQRVVNSAAREQHGLNERSGQWDKTSSAETIDGRPLREAEAPLARAATGEVVREARWRVRYKDGSTRVLVGTATPLRHDDGSPAGAVLMTRDDTERLAFEERQTATLQALRRSETRLRLLSDASRELGESFHDTESTLRRVTELAASDVATYCVADLLQRDQTVLRVAAAHHDGARADLTNALTSYPPRGELLRVVRSVAESGRSTLIREVQPSDYARFAHDATHLAIIQALAPRSAMLVPVTSGETVVAVVSFVLCDPIRRYANDDLAMAEELARRASAALEKTRLFAAAKEAVFVRDEFLSIASHELKTPLTTLMLQVEAFERRLGDLTRDEARTTVQNRIAVIRRQLERLHRLVTELLDLSRIIGGRLRLDLQLVDFGEVVRQVLSDLREHGELLHAETQVELDLEPGISGQWDRVRLEQVVGNLVSNAVKYGAGRPVIVSLRRQEDTAVLSVVDHGIGIPEADQARIFGRFERAASTRHYGGLGLGLYIVNQIVEAMGGAVDVVSAPGRGARFTVALPVSGPPRTEHAAPTLH
jgi:PAS domain S-box-containing protein